MASRIQSEELAIKHVGEPGDWMPIRSVTGRKRPGHILPAKPGPHVRVLNDVPQVVEVNEFVMNYRPVSGQRGCAQKRTNQKCAKLIIWTVHRGLLILRKEPRGSMRNGGIEQEPTEGTEEEFYKR